MASINTWVFSGRLSSDAMQRNTCGFEALFHMNVSPSRGQRLWVACIWRGKKAEEAFDLLTKGTLVCIEGALGPREPDFSGAVITNVRNVIFEDDDGADLREENRQ